MTEFKMTKIIKFPIAKQGDLNDLSEIHSRMIEVFTKTYIEKIEIGNLEFEIDSWGGEHNYEFPYLIENKNKDLNAFKLVQSMIVGLHLNFSSRALKEYKSTLNHIRNFDFHELAISLRASIELSMMMFYVTNRIEKALKAKEVKNLLQIILRASYATRQQVIFPNDFTRFFLNKLEILGLKKEKTFHINDAFDYFWKNESTINVDLEDKDGGIEKKDWILGGKQFSDTHKDSFTDFYNILCEEVHPLGMLSSLPNKEYFFQEEIDKGIVKYLQEIEINIDTFGNDRDQKILSFFVNLKGKMEDFQISFICLFIG